MAIEDVELLEYLLSETNPKVSDDKIKDIIENEVSYFYSWQSVKSRDFKEFTFVANVNDCVQSLYYVIMNDKGNIISYHTIADHWYCAMPGWIYYSTTEFKGNSNFVKYVYKKEADIGPVYP